MTKTTAAPAPGPARSTTLTLRTPEEWTDELRRLQKDCFLVGPVQEIRTIPEGFELTVTRILLDPEGECFKVGSEGWGDNRVDFVALTKSAIESLSIAVNAVAQAVRVDDRSERRYCEYSATGSMKLLDGSLHVTTASRAYDLREGGSDYVAEFERASAKRRKDQEYAIKDQEEGKRPKVPVLPPEKLEAACEAAGRAAVDQAYATMQRNCESKAKLRALRSVMGIRSKYKLSEIRRKHFAIPHLSATGRTDDPVLRREFARMLFARATSATHALYGPSAAQGASGASSRALPHPTSPTPLALPHAEPPDPAEATQVDLVDQETGEVIDAQPAEPPPPAQPAPAPEKAAPPAAKPGSTIPKGRGLPGEGKAIRDAAPEELQGCIAAVSKLIDAGSLDAAQQTGAEKFRDACIASLNERELASRGGEPGGAQAEMFS